MLTGLQIHSQNISKENKKVTTYINTKGDTMVVMGYEDARTLLRDVLVYEYTDSLLTIYKERDNLNTNTIVLQKDIINKVLQKNTNLETITSNLEQISVNKDVEILLKDDIIKQQKKEIRKQKILKIVGFTTSIVLPVITLFAIIGLN